MAVKLDTLGKGWAFPFRFDAGTGGVARASGLELVKMSIRQIVLVRVGSRVVLRAFGSPLRDMVFSPIQPDLEMLLGHFVREALERWERRVRVDSVDVDVTHRDEGKVDISVKFTLLSTQQEGNLVVPFFLAPDERKRLAEVT